MLSALKSEFRKLFSIRSTYFITLLAVVLIGGLLNFFAQGYKATGDLNNPEFLSSVSLMTVTFVSVFTGIISLLLVTHEYRYNTIMYTLTSSNSRTKTFIAKAIVIAIYAVLVGGLMTVLGPILTKLGVAMQGVELVDQNIQVADIAWRALFYSFGNAMAALVMASIIRNQIGAILTYFVIASMVEELLTLVLRSNAKYLPFRALNEVVNFSAQAGDIVKDPSALSVPQNAAIFSIYLIVGLVVSWLLFIKRDAN